MTDGSLNRADMLRSVARQVRRGVTVLRSADRRRQPRIKGGETLSSNLGRVLNLSAGGVRVVCRRKLRGFVDLALWDIHRGLTVTAQVVWTKRLGFRRYECGLKFIEVSPEAARNLTALGADNGLYEVTEVGAAGDDRANDGRHRVRSRDADGGMSQ